LRADKITVLTEKLKALDAVTFMYIHSLSFEIIRVLIFQHDNESVWHRCTQSTSLWNS